MVHRGVEELQEVEPIKGDRRPREVGLDPGDEGRAQAASTFLMPQPRGHWTRGTNELLAQ